jgi:tetratricopeptide (TPR) repeat protein
MRALLNSLGFALWGATAIILATGVAVVGYRVASTAKPPPAAATEFVLPRLTESELQPSPSASTGPRHAETDIEAAMATGQYSPEDARARTKELFELAGQNQQYAKAIEYGKQLSDQGALAPNDLIIMAQLYFVQKDCKNAAVWADKAIAAYKKSGEAPKETPYQFKLQCASDAGDMASMEGPLMDLIRLTNKSTYWNDLLRIERQEERDDHNLLMIYRIMYNTGSMKEGSDYIEMAQLLGDAALPGEAAAVLQKAGAAGLIKPEQQERVGRLQRSLQDRADEDRRGLPQGELSASRSPGGGSLVKLGQLYYGLGDYQEAADALTQGQRREQTPPTDDVYVYLGLANVHLGNIQAAEESFARLKLLPTLSPRVLKLWQLYAATLGTADVSSPPEAAARPVDAAGLQRF